MLPSTSNRITATRQPKLMMDGNPLSHDITMIRHELMECELMKGGMSQAETHAITTEVYDYEKEAKAFYGKTD